MLLDGNTVTVEMLPINSIRPYPRNARTHSAEQIDQIAASIVAFGWLNPLLVDDSSNVVSGHGRLLAAKKLGVDVVPVLRASHLTPAQVRAYRLADNRLAELSGWDNDLLRVEFGDLAAGGFDLGLSGFSADDIDKIMANNTVGLTDPDEAPEAPQEPVSALGDVWLLGHNRLVCGDSTSPGAAAAALNEVNPHLMVTDPPHGIDYNPGWRTLAYTNRDRAVGKVVNDDRADWTDAYALFPGDVAYVWTGARQVEFYTSLVAAGFDIRMQIIWSKSHFAISRGHYHLQHESCWYAVRKRRTAHWSGDRKQTSLWEIDKPIKSDTGHSTQKPVECMLRPIKNNSSPGQSVYDPFVGSGTTIIAAEMMGRVCHAIELNPTYVDVSVERWQNFTGRAATLEQTGMTFAETAAERVK